MSLLLAQSGHPAATPQCPLMTEPDIEICLLRSLWLEVGKLHHLPPLRGFRCDEGTEFGWRTRKCRTTKLDQPGLDLCIGKAGIGHAVESLNDCRGRIRRRADADPLARLETRHDRAHRRNVRKELGLRRPGHRQSTQPSRADEIDEQQYRADDTVDLATKRIGDCRRAAAIGDQDDIRSR
jgi:hypothetical protein